MFALIDVTEQALYLASWVQPLGFIAGASAGCLVTLRIYKLLRSLI